MFRLSGVVANLEPFLLQVLVTELKPQLCKYSVLAESISQICSPIYVSTEFLAFDQLLYASTVFLLSLHQRAKRPTFS